VNKVRAEYLEHPGPWPDYVDREFVELLAEKLILGRGDISPLDVNVPTDLSEFAPVGDGQTGLNK
jgi:hypothetical protein